MKKISNLNQSEIRKTRYIIAVFLVPCGIYAFIGSNGALSRYVEAVAILLLFILGMVEYLNNYKFIAIIDFLFVVWFSYSFLQ
ncbi:hypothetical protein [Alkalibacterium kapii]|uniref:Phosphatidate cytidylyltransferase n=1 Tax=Alkalibacterium kapii TaxID=426704 RepID=A0A511AVB6_9LACT|nr:hypothetical protein [Alkalibacterium kapii]GEK92096.1 hypothetical protein AKA01nite_17180 [Alkalibacterium kapii]